MTDIEPNDVLRADDEALRVAGTAGVRVRTLHHRAELADLLQLFDRVWSLSPMARPVSKDTLLALAHAGNPILGAFDGDTMVGGSLGMLGSHGPRSLHVHSHMTGVHPEHQHRRIGRALKLRQRAWALTHGIGSIVWTFDPLVRRNGWFNLQVLGAVGEDYLVDFYGPIDDAINGGDETDRLLVRWDLLGHRTSHACTHGTAPQPDIPAGALCLLEPGPDDTPTVTAWTNDMAVAVATVAVPDDIVEIRRRHPGLGRMWRSVVREVLGTAFDRGFHVAGMSRSTAGPARYVLTTAR